MRLPFPTLLTLTLLTGGCALNPFGSGNLAEYDLVSIHGEQLPAAYVVQPGTNLTLVEVLSSRIVLRDDRTGEEKVTQRQPGGPVEDITNRLSFQNRGSRDPDHLRLSGFRVLHRRPPPDWTNDGQRARVRFRVGTDPTGVFQAMTPRA